MNSYSLKPVDEKLATMKATFKRLFSFIVSRKLEADEPISCNWAECVVDDSPLTVKELAMEDLESAPAKLDDLKAEVKDTLEDFNVEIVDDPKILYVCAT